MALSYRGKQVLLGLLRKVPGPLRDRVIETVNPLRVAYVNKFKTLRWVTLFITNYCNARCQHCFYWKELNTKKPELSTEELNKTFGSLVHRLNTVRLSGGEPFLRKDLPEFFLYLDARKITTKMGIPTNGMIRMLPPLEQMLAGSRFTHLNVSVSLDGMENRHNEFRGVRGGFALAMENLREMVKLEKHFPRFNVSASVSLVRDLVHRNGNGRSEAEDLIEYLRNDIGVRSIGYDHIRSAGEDVFSLPPGINSQFAPPPKIGETEDGNRHKRSGNIQLDVDEMEEVNERLLKYESNDTLRLNHRRMQLQVEIKRSRSRIVDCMAGTVDCVIYPDGAVAACEFTTPFANLHDFRYNLRELWLSPAAEQQRALTRKCACTHPCHLSDSMAYDTKFLKFYAGTEASGHLTNGSLVKPA